MTRHRVVAVMAILAVVAALATACGGPAESGPSPGSGAGSYGSSDGQADPAGEPSPGATDEEAVRNLVEEFGRRLALVSLQAPEDMVQQSLEEHYGDLVTPELLERWQSNPADAPGRVVSSPWPDRIEIATVEQRSETSYEVQGHIIEITSQEKAESGVAASRAVTLSVVKVGDRWLIDEVTLGEYETAAYDLPAAGDGTTLAAGSP